MKLKWIGSLLILAGVVGCKTPDRPNLVEYVNPVSYTHLKFFTECCFKSGIGSFLNWI